MLTDNDVIQNLPAELRRRRKENNPTGRHIYIDGIMVGTPDGYTFTASAPHTYCRICGAVYQTQQDRDSVLNYQLRVPATLRRKRWSFEHAATHSIRLHQAFAASGRYMTAEAAHKLVPLGIIPLSDMALDPATEQAANEAPRLDAPTQDRMEELRDAVL